MYGRHEGTYNAYSDSTEADLLTDYFLGIYIFNIRKIYIYVYYKAMGECGIICIFNSRQMYTTLREKICQNNLKLNLINFNTLSLCRSFINISLAYLVCMQDGRLEEIKSKEQNSSVCYWFILQRQHLTMFYSTFSVLNNSHSKWLNRGFVFKAELFMHINLKPEKLTRAAGWIGLRSKSLPLE